MIKHFEIDRFRCFRHLAISGLRRINLITGENAAGKTALLEALFLASGATPELFFKAQSWRGLGLFSASPVKESYENLFRNLFYGFDKHSTIVVSFQDSDRGPRSLSIAFDPADDHQISLPLEGKERIVESTMLVPIRFSWKSDLSSHTSIVTISEDQLRMTGSNDYYPAVFFSTMHGLGLDNVNRFSKLSRQNRSLSIITAVREAFPQIEDITVEFEGGLGSLYVSVIGISEKIPIGLLSAGISKYLSILLAISDAQEGAVFIDEIENGLHYTILPKLMRSIVKFCEDNNSQVFASTHSFEFLESLGDIVAQAPDKFSLIRMGHDKDGATARLYSGHNLNNALKQRVEVR